MRAYLPYLLLPLAVLLAPWLARQFEASAPPVPDLQVQTFVVPKGMERLEAHRGPAPPVKMSVFFAHPE